MNAQKLLLVTSHPDDEVMYYSPLLLALRRKQVSCVHILCLSNGDFEGLGHIRANELYHACEVMQIPADHVTVVNHPALRDGPNVHWSPVLIADIIIAHVNTLQPDAVVTFDEHGVSGHTNHVHTHQGCLLAVSQLQLERNTTSDKRSKQQQVRGYVLQSPPWYRKYIGPCDLLASLWGSEQDVAVSANLIVLYRAMTAHRSQCQWYRVLFLLFSRLSFINSFAEMFPSDGGERGGAPGASDKSTASAV